MAGYGVSKEDNIESVGSMVQTSGTSRVSKPGIQKYEVTRPSRVELIKWNDHVIAKALP